MEITLIRHGKPASTDSPKVNALEYTQWIRRYNLSPIAEDSRPNKLRPELASYYVMSSDIKRAIHSAEIYTGRQPDHISSLYKEMELPRYKLPFRLKPLTWVYLCRALWMIGKRGPFESYRHAKERAVLAAEQLVTVAQENGQVVLFGHGYLNIHIRKILVRKGWLLNGKSSDYWGVTTLTAP